MKKIHTLLLARLEAFENWQDSRLAGGSLRIGDRETPEAELAEAHARADARVRIELASGARA